MALSKHQQKAAHQLEEHRKNTVAGWGEWALVIKAGNRGRFRWSLHHGPGYELRAYSGVNGVPDRAMAHSEGIFFLDAIRQAAGAKAAIAEAEEKVATLMSRPTHNDLKGARRSRDRADARAAKARKQRNCAWWLFGLAVVGCIIGEIVR